MTKLKVTGLTSLLIAVVYLLIIFLLSAFNNVYWTGKLVAPVVIFLILGVVIEAIGFMIDMYKNNL